ncbi:MAG: putative alpha/beta hydrolase [Terrestrivirus sp.]|uniref:Putative alpha/beta hydrolase n=1 Tax=Terrestrivirus sp. TaxID=2487775 RepID=A0A3G4ZLX9_9VIRU|nr:MAG: putative alpha/beta hydrolase [Terrestrivirus sp.]
MENIQNVQNLQNFLSMMLLMSDDLIKSKVFQIPNTDKELIRNMENLFNTKTKSGYDVYGILIKTKNTNKLNKLIIYSHGTGNDIYNVHHLLKDFSDKYGVDIVCYDYPGYGLVSAEKMNEEGCYECHEAVVDYVINVMSIPKNEIILMGQSLGTGVTADYVSKHDWEKPVILVSGYKSIPRIIVDNEIVDTLKNQYQFNTMSKLDKVKCHIIMVHGDVDALIPVSHAHEMKKMRPDITLEIVQGAGHVDVIDKIDENKVRQIFDMF